MPYFAVNKLCVINTEPSNGYILAYREKINQRYFTTKNFKKCVFNH